MNVQRLLSFIGQIEANGQYNAVYGDAYSPHDLSAFTLDEVLAKQHLTVNAGGQSATGRYQFIRKTLAGLKDELGLSGEERFTPALQDHLATRLLERRGLKRWAAGTMTDAEFADSLAREWASLPEMDTGRSYYAGDGLNKSLTTPADVLRVLAETRGDPPIPIDLPDEHEPAPAPSGGFSFWAWLKGLFA